MFEAKKYSMRISNTFLLLLKSSISVRALSTFRPILISIEGNIGAGKSTLIESLKLKNPTWNFVDEPVGMWSSLKDDNGKSLLETFYEDRKRWSYTFQSCALLSRFQNIENTIQESLRLHNHNKAKNGNEIFITERCLDTDFFVFTKMLRQENSINSMEYEIYRRLYSHLKSTATQLGGIIHVDTDPVECSRRIFSRSRSGENNIPLEYLENLNRCQNKWIDSCDFPILKSNEADDILSRIDSFVIDVIKHSNL